MKHLLIAVLLACCQVVSAQSIDQIIDSKIKASEARQKAYSDSLFKARGPGFPKCNQGPTVASISSITNTSLSARITGEGLTRIAISIYDEDSTKKYYANTFQYNSTENSITFDALPAGKYKLYASAINCTGVGSRAFTIKSDEPGKADCPRGPTLSSIKSAMPASVDFQFDGEGVFGIDYEIQTATGTSVYKGSVAPQSSVVTASGFVLPDGDYKLYIKGGTCNNKKPEENNISKPFTIKTGSTGGGGVPDPSAKYQIIMGTTGGGFQPEAQYGIDPQWVERIEAFKYDWGYGISGICLWVGWNGYEKTPGVYQEEGFKKVIKFCRDRGLTLSVAFMGKRNEGDGIIRDDEIIRGSNGTKYIEGVPGFGAIYAGYSNDRVNALMSGAIKSIAKLMKTYDKSFYMAMAGGGAGELVNHTFQNNGLWEVSDLSPDSKNRFNEWAIRRGIVGPGPPPIIQGPGIDWPHPNYRDSTGLEFGRFTTYGIYKYYKSFVDAVKSVSDIPCLYFYSVTSNRQFRAIQNPNINFIASPGDGLYGSDGDGLDDLKAKVKVNSLNLGTFPNAISSTEVDPDDISPARMLYGRMPSYCEGNLNYDAFLKLSRDLFSRGLQVLHFAMSFCPQEIKGFEPVLKTLRQEYVGRDYVRPAINSSNTVTVEVTDKYRNSQDLMEGIDPYSKYTKYTDYNFWGSVKPEGATGPTGGGSTIDNSKLTGYLDNNLGAYNGNVLVDVKTPSGTVYSYAKGQYSRDQLLSAMSHSKLAVGATLLTFYDDGRIGMDDKVSKFIPSWKRADKANITIRQVVSHTSGIRDETSFDGYPTLEAAVDGMSTSPLDFTPGTQFKYSTTSYQILARIAEVLADKHWEQIFNERIRDKCAMGSAIFNPKGDLQPITGNPLNPNAGYGLWCSENGWSNFVAMIRDGGTFNGQQVLSPKAIGLLKTNMTGGLGNWGFGVILGPNGELISESAVGWGTTIMPGKWSLVVATKSTYEKTLGPNNGFRDLVKSML